MGLHEWILKDSLGGIDFIVSCCCSAIISVAMYKMWVRNHPSKLVQPWTWTVIIQQKECCFLLNWEAAYSLKRCGMMFAERFPSSALAWTLKTRPPPDHYCLQLVLTLLHASHKKSASHGFPGDLTQALGSTRKPQTLNWFWSQDSSYSNGPTSNSEKTALSISCSEKKALEK